MVDEGPIFFFCFYSLIHGFNPTMVDEGLAGYAVDAGIERV
jgi:hypothetical protein